MELRRKVYQKLLEWKQNRHGRTAVIIEGAWRVGKSHIAKRFAENEYRSYLLIDFSYLTAQVKEVFEHDIHDFDLFFQKLSVLYHTPLYVKESLNNEPFAQTLAL